MDVSSSLKQLLDRARRREVSQVALDVTALATGILMAGAIVLLLTGTEILNWYWLLLLFAGSGAVGAYRLRKTISSRYALAQRIDRRMQLADELSTAYYFEENPRPDRASVCERQRAHAERVAGQVDVRQALPFKRSRFLMPAAVLAMAALGLFAVRYLIVGSLDLGPSLVRMAYDSFFGNKTLEAENRAKKVRLDPVTGQPNPDSPSLDKDLQPDETLDAGESQQGNADSPDNAKEAAEGSNKSKEDGQQNGENDKNAGNDPNQQNGKEQDKNDAKDGDQNKSDKQDSKGGNNSSLMDKVRDAVSDLVNKLKPNSDKQDKGDKSQKSQPGDQKQQADKGQKSQDQQSQNSSQQDQQGQGGDEKQQSDASTDKKASDKSVSQDSKNGIGSQDGEKALKEAAQLQAMGKITEILGKRSAQITGEVMVEVGSSKQQLKTPLAPSDAKHTEAGGELHRDEIPLLYQPFVQQYFEEIRKNQAAPFPATTKK